VLLCDKYTKLFGVANGKDGKTGKLQEKDDALRLDFVAQPEYHKSQPEEPSATMHRQYIQYAALCRPSSLTLCN